MRFLRAVIIGILAIFPGTIVGFLGWIAVGQSMDNSSLGVTLFCTSIELTPLSLRIGQLSPVSDLMIRSLALRN